MIAFATGRHYLELLAGSSLIWVTATGFESCRRIRDSPNCSTGGLDRAMVVAFTHPNAGCASMAVSITRIRTGALAIAMALVLTLAGAAAAGAATHMTPGSNPAQLNPASAIPWGTPGLDPLAGTAATGCTGEMPGARDVFQFLNHWWPRGELIDIYTCRGVGSTGSWSLHAEGRAVDFHLDVDNAGDKEAGVAIRKFFLASDSRGNKFAMARRFGIHELIWNRNIWTSERANEGWRDYNVPAGGSPHTDHIHVGLTRRAGNRNTSAWTGRCC
jgi:hypothetical protein